jgi:hypothetical protein
VPSDVDNVKLTNAIPLIGTSGMQRWLGPPILEGIDEKKKTKRKEKWQ